MGRLTGYTFWHAPCAAAMALEEGAWTDNDKYKDGGYFASPMDKDMFVALTTRSFTVKKATASTDVIVGKLISEPQGEHTTYGRQGTILLLGDYVLELEVHTASDTLAVGGYVQLSASGGKYGEGLWFKDTTSNGTLVLASSTASGSIASGSVIPVLVGYDPF